MQKIKNQHRMSVCMSHCTLELTKEYTDINVLIIHIKTKNYTHPVNTSSDVLHGKMSMDVTL